MTVKDLREFIFENYYWQIGFFTKQNSYYLLNSNIKQKYFVLLAINLMKKIPDPNTSKEQHRLFLKNKGKRIGKMSKIIKKQTSVT